MLKGLIWGALGLGVLVPSFAALPATTNYGLQSYGFGSGGTAGSNTSNYSVEGVTGELSGQTTSTSNYTTLPGFVQTEQANVPKLALTNPSNYYDKLKFVIDPQGNPTDALYALQISTTSNFSSGVFYIQPDDTLSSTLVVGDYQTFAAWGGSGGSTIIGLSSSTTYYLRAKATQGKFTESAYGPSGSAATVGQQISFCLYSNANCGAGGSSEAFGGLTAGTPINSPTNIGIDFATNANGGGQVYIYDLNAGLKSQHSTYTINSSSANLASASEGFGAQITSIGQTSGGPLASAAPYNGSANNVGGLSTIASYLLSANSPIVGGTAAVQLQAKASNLTPAASDYADTLTFIAAASF